MTTDLITTILRTGLVIAAAGALYCLALAAGEWRRVRWMRENGQR